MFQRAFSFITREAIELDINSALQIHCRPHWHLPAHFSDSEPISLCRQTRTRHWKVVGKSRASRQVTDTDDLDQRNGPQPVQAAINDSVLIWEPAQGSGVNARPKAWYGPYSMRAVDDEQVTVDFNNGTSSTFRSTHVRPCESTEPIEEPASRRGPGRPRK
ncbi:MAG: hypothetical protein SEPTF4163_003597 [Sporothrix epigloea]